MQATGLSRPSSKPCVGRGCYAGGQPKSSGLICAACRVSGRVLTCRQAVTLLPAGQSLLSAARVWIAAATDRQAHDSYKQLGLSRQQGRLQRPCYVWPFLQQLHMRCVMSKPYYLLLQASVVEDWNVLYGAGCLLYASVAACMPSKMLVQAQRPLLQACLAPYGAPLLLRQLWVDGGAAGGSSPQLTGHVMCCMPCQGFQRRFCVAATQNVQQGGTCASGVWE